jgi:hypothetical protein
MKVLVTGCTGQQVGRGTRLHYEPVVNLYVKALCDMGLQVEHREVTPKEDISKYDRIFVGLVPPSSIAAAHYFNVLALIGRANWDRLIFYVDDWKFDGLIKPLREGIPLDWWLERPFITKSREWASTKGRSQLGNAIAMLKEFKWPRVLIPKYSWGRGWPQGLFPGQHVQVDPSGYATMYDYPQMPKEKRWVLGIISDQQKWLSKLGAKWPVLHVGSKADTSVKEPELVRLYHQSTGVLSPFYPKLAGTGWWRNRFLYAAHANAYLYCDPQETTLMSYRSSISDIESWDFETLGRNVMQQRDEFLTSIWGKKALQWLFTTLVQS